MKTKVDDAGDRSSDWSSCSSSLPSQDDENYAAGEIDNVLDEYADLREQRSQLKLIIGDLQKDLRPILNRQIQTQPKKVITKNKMIKWEKTADQ